MRPIDDVNLHQSTNDVYPTALKVAAIRGFRSLAAAIAALQGALQRREAAFARVLKIGRTELVEAVPMTLGMEFSAFAEAVGRDRWRTFKCEERLRTVNLGGTALGTGLTAPREFIFLAVERLREVTGLPLARAENLVAETAGADAFVEVSGILKAHAATLLKMSGDLRLLAMLGEIRLPGLQAGSSVMPGKVNPVLLELAAQVALKAMANDLLVTEAVSRAHLQISELLPLLARALLESLELLAELDVRLAAHIDGIVADEERCRETLWKSPGLITAFVPRLGYEGASRLAEEFQGRGGDCHAFLVEKLGRGRGREVLSPENLTALGTPAQGGGAAMTRGALPERGPQGGAFSDRPFRPDQHGQVEPAQLHRRLGRGRDLARGRHHDRRGGEGHGAASLGTGALSGHGRLGRRFQLWATAAGRRPRPRFSRCDAVLLVLEAPVWGEVEESVLQGLRRASVPLILVVNKTDLRAAFAGVSGGLAPEVAAMS